MSTASLPTGAALELLLERSEIAFYDLLYAAAPQTAARTAGLEIERHGERRRFTLRQHDHPLWNRAMGLGLSASLDDAWIDDTVAHFAAAGVRRFMLQLLPQVMTEELAGSLRERGLVALRGWAKHLGPTASAAALPPSPPSVGLVDEDEAEIWARLVASVYGLPEDPFVPWFAATVGHPRLRHYLAFRDGRPIAAAMLHLAPPIAHLNFAGTLPDAERGGAQSALIARRLRDAAVAGCRWAMCETDEELPDRPNPSYHNIVRHGLQARYVRANWGPPKPP